MKEKKEKYKELIIRLPTQSKDSCWTIKNQNDTRNYKRKQSQGKSHNKKEQKNKKKINVY